MRIHGVCNCFSRLGEGICAAGGAILTGTQKVAMAILGCPFRVARGCFLAGRAVLGCVGMAVMGTARKVGDTFSAVFGSKSKEPKREIKIVSSSQKVDSCLLGQPLTSMGIPAISTSSSELEIPEEDTEGDEEISTQAQPPQENREIVPPSGQIEVESGGEVVVDQRETPIEESEIVAAVAPSGQIEVESDGDVDPREPLVEESLPISGDLMRSRESLLNDLTSENINLSTDGWEIIGGERELELKESMCNVLNEIKDGSFTRGVFDRLYVMSEKIYQYREKTGESPVITRDGFIRPVFNSILERDRIVVFHKINPSLNGDAKTNFTHEQEIMQFVKEWAQKYQGTRLVAETIGRGCVWASDKRIVFERESNDSVKAALFHRELSKFYGEYNVSNPEELAHALMVRMSGEYSSIIFFAQLSALEEGYNLSAIPMEGCGFHFGFENGRAIVSQKNRYEKKEVNMNEESQFFEITRTISLDPNNISSSWDEVVTITKNQALKG